METVQVVGLVGFLLGMKKIRLGLVFGGQSVEHEVSVQSARNVFAALDREKYDVTLIGIDKQGSWRVCDTALLQAAESPAARLPDCVGDMVLAFVPGRTISVQQTAGAPTVLPQLDVALPLLHGRHGEDGTIQGMLSLANVPCVGAGVLGSAIGMDKDVTKRLLRDAGIPVAHYVALSANAAAGKSFTELVGALGCPFFVKPANAGSSVGISKVRSDGEWRDARALALRYDRKLLVEEFVRGREIEVAVLGNDEPEASVAGEIIPSHEFYSYEAKYLDENGARLRIPAELPPSLSEKVRTLAVQAFRVLEAAGMARVDFFVTDDGRIFLNEINTIPGFTRISMYPKLWEASGLSYGALIDRLVQLALERHAEEGRLETQFDPDWHEKGPEGRDV